MNPFVKPPPIEVQHMVVYIKTHKGLLTYAVDESFTVEDMTKSALLSVGDKRSVKKAYLVGQGDTVTLPPKDLIKDYMEMYDWFSLRLRHGG